MYFQRLEDLREVYRRYERGVHEIPVWAVIKLAKYYQTSTDYILGLTDIRKPNWT